MDKDLMIGYLRRNVYCFNGCIDEGFIPGCWKRNLYDSGFSNLKINRSFNKRQAVETVRKLKMKSIAKAFNKYLKMKKSEHLRTHSHSQN